MDGLRIILCILPPFYLFPPLLRVHALYGVSVSLLSGYLVGEAAVFSRYPGCMLMVFFLDGKGAVKLDTIFIILVSSLDVELIVLRR
jgi:hypothetical protein